MTKDNPVERCSVQQQVKQLQNRYSRKAPLWELLDDELRDVYNGELPTNLSVEFLRACYTSIAPGEDPHDRLEKYHDNYSEQWVQSRTEQAQLATALKLLLHERVSRSEGDVINSATIQLLSELIVAMRTASDEYADQWLTDEEREKRLGAAPERGTPPESPFKDELSFEEALTPKLADWLDERRSESAGSHAVYVLNCTPEIGEAEDSKIRSLRSRVATSDTVTDPVEKAARAVNNNERVFYVGSANDIRERMQRHDRLPSYGGANFTATFQPNALVEVSWHETRGEALEHEQKRAQELTRPGESYAYSEQK